MVKGMKITNKLVTLKAFKTLAWGIGSIKVRGVEYLDMHDDGRGFQSSYRPKAKGEAYNPTQHGSSAKDSGINDGKGFSHSVNHFKINDQLAIYTDTQMAYFRPVRGKTLSNFRLRQWVSLHALGYWNVIRVNNKLIIPKNEPIHKPDAGVWEAMCAYVSSSLFSDFGTSLGLHFGGQDHKKWGPKKKLKKRLENRSAGHGESRL